MTLREILIPVGFVTETSFNIIFVLIVYHIKALRFKISNIFKSENLDSVLKIW